MRYTIIAKVLGLLFMVFSFTMLPPVGVSLWYGEGTSTPFIIAFFLILLAGVLCWLPVRGQTTTRFGE